MNDLASLKPRDGDCPLVSVVIPCYNVEKYISQCLNSIFDNGYANIEVICVDDRSEDKTVGIISKFQNIYPNLTLIKNTQDHLYGGGCRNLGMEKARGKYIYFCDSDDYILPGLIPTCVRKCEEFAADACFFQYSCLLNNKFCRPAGVRFDYIFDKTSPTFNIDTVRNIFTMAGVQQWNKFYNREFICRIGAKFQGLKNSNDQTFGICTGIHAKRVVALPDSFYVYRIASESSVQKGRMNGDNPYDVIEAFKLAHQMIVDSGSMSAKAQFKGYVLHELNYMKHHKIRLSSDFMGKLKMFMSSVGEYDPFLDDEMEKLDVSEPKEFDAIISFATYGKRINSPLIYRFLDSLVHQDCNIRHRIVANIWKRDYDEAPEKFKQYLRDNNIEVLTSDFNWKSHLKYVMSMQKYKDVPVVTVDDDMVYRKDMLQLLHAEHKKNPRTIICGHAKRIDWDSEGNTKKYRSWPNFQDSSCPRDDILPVGVGGILYPPEFCKLIDDGTTKKIMRMGVLDRDDFFLHHFAIMNSIWAKVVETPYPYNRYSGVLVEAPIEELSSNETALWRENSYNRKNNDSIWMFDIGTGIKNRPLVFSTVNAGTNTFTNITAKSILKHHPSAKVFVVDVVPNQRFTPIDEEMMKNVEVIEGIPKESLDLPTIDVMAVKNLTDDEKRTIVNRIGFNPVPMYFSGDTHHSTNIQFAIDTIGQNFVLIDSDAPLKRPVDFIDNRCSTIAGFQMCEYKPHSVLLPDKGLSRITPYLQYFNVSKLREKGVCFFDKNIIKDNLKLASRWKPNPIYGDEMTSTNYTFLIVTGVLFTDQLLKRDCRFSTIQTGDYIDHFGAGTWNNQKNRMKSEFYAKYKDLFKNPIC